ncbi:DUF805 domain-containing protein [Lactococcus termiticola]|uniref:Putative membrane protein n=1 Tax=Lactococcus termiticola TaxID=2169526 RepID=A0A2R5HDR3_9LACT|nr:DUF805 domain-containing protein [Lactococcus termiticola]GBG96207.1 putative membrane protein [Lactococcus termiticola]
MKAVYQTFWKNYREINGRASRRDFWLTQLVHLLVLVGLALLALIFKLLDSFSVLPSFWTALRLTSLLLLASYLLISLLPNLSLMIRRLNAVGLPKLLVLLMLAPVVGQIVLIIFLCLPDQRERLLLGLSPVVEESEKTGPKQALMDYFRGYFDFTGRTSRAGFWWMALFLVILGLILTGIYGTGWLLSAVLHLEGPAPILFVPVVGLSVLLAVALVIPTLAMQVRRLRDAGLAGKWTILIYGGILLSLLLSRSLAYVSLISYGRNSYAMLEQLLFLLALVLMLAIFVFSLTPKDGLLEEVED